MSISTNYATPVIVNGFSCNNCTDVSEAKKFIDPAHPKSGPFGVDAKSDPTVTSTPAFQLSATLAAQVASNPTTTTSAAASATGSRLNISA